MTDKPSDAEGQEADVAPAQADPADADEPEPAGEADDEGLDETSDGSDAENAEEDDLAESSEAEELADDSSAAELADDSSAAELADDSSAAEVADDSSEAEDAELADESSVVDEQTDETPDDDAPPTLDLPEFDDPDEQGEEWLAGLFERMELDVDSAIERDGDQLEVDLSGDDADRLLGLGKLGPKAIEGVETLFEAVFAGEDRDDDIYFDVDGQRRARKEMLQRVAGEMADKSVELDKVLTISGLNSTERRIIHRRLRDYDEVRTESVGDGVFRRLRIEPTD